MYRAVAAAASAVDVLNSLPYLLEIDRYVSLRADTDTDYY